MADTSDRPNSEDYLSPPWLIEQWRQRAIRAEAAVERAAIALRSAAEAFDAAGMQVAASDAHKAHHAALAPEKPESKGEHGLSEGVRVDSPAPPQVRSPIRSLLGADEEAGLSSGPTPLAESVCPTCGSDDPATCKRGAAHPFGQHWTQGVCCRDPYHRGGEVK